MRQHQRHDHVDHDHGGGGHHPEADEQHQRRHHLAQIDRVGQKAGQAALEDTVYFEKTRAAIVDTRAWTKQQLEARGFAVLDSRSNFLFASTQKKNGGELYQKLKKKGVLVRHFDAPRIENWLRITIGTPEQMQIFLNTLDKIMEE